MAKKIKVQVEVEKYQAIDGTVFDTEDQCKRYDNSAIVVLKTKLLEVAKKLTPEETRKINSEWSEDYTCYLLTVTEKTCDWINQLRACIYGSSDMYSYKQKEEHIMAMYISNFDEGVYFTDMTDQLLAFNDLCKDL